jgi:hypothetical protein
MSETSAAAGTSDSRLEGLLDKLTVQYQVILCDVQAARKEISEMRAEQCPDCDAVSLVGEFMRVLREAEGAARRSVMDGTVSCRVCRAVVLEDNIDGHAAWHNAFPYQEYSSNWSQE